jgi:hypothetical protein
MFLGVKAGCTQGLVCLQEGLKPDNSFLSEGQHVCEPRVDLEPAALAPPGYVNRRDDLPVAGIDEILELQPNGVERGREFFKVMEDRPVALIGARFRRGRWRLQFDLRIDQVGGGWQVAFNEGFVKPASDRDVLVGHPGEVWATVSVDARQIVPYF